MRRNKGLSLILGLNIIGFLIDFILSINIKHINLIEANPLFNLGGFWLITFANILAFSLMFIWYVRVKSPDVRFMLITYLTTMLMFRILIIINNYNLLIHPVTYEYAITLTEETKIAIYSKVALSTLTPVLSGIISWFFFRVDHIIKIKE